MFHGGNTESEVDALVATICNWASEMVEIEKGSLADGDGVKGMGMAKGKLPRAAQQVYSLMAVNA